MNFIFTQMSERVTLYNIIWKSLTGEGKNSSDSVEMSYKSLSEALNMQII